MEKGYEGVIEVVGLPLDLNAFKIKEIFGRKKTEIGYKMNSEVATHLSFVGSQDTSQGLLNLIVTTTGKIDMEAFRELSGTYNLSFNIYITYALGQEAHYHIAHGKFKSKGQRVPMS